jgi:hypothetical protein
MTLKSSIILLFAAVYLQASGQNQVISKRIVAKGSVFSFNGETQNSRGVGYYADLSYSINKYIDIGPYFSYSDVSHLTQWVSSVDLNQTGNETARSGLVYLPSKTLFYGVNSTFQFIPLILQTNHFRFDVYGIARVGLVSAQWPVLNGTTYDNITQQPRFEGGAGFGVSFYVTPNIGVYYEYLKGSFYNNDNFRIHLGVVCRVNFKNKTTN